MKRDKKNIAPPALPGYNGIRTPGTLFEFWDGAARKEATVEFDFDQLMLGEASKALLHQDVEQRNIVSNATTRQRLLRAASQGLSAKKAAILVQCSYDTAKKAYKDKAFQLAAVEMVNGNMEKLDFALREKDETMSDKISRASQIAFDVLLDTLENEEVSPSLRVRVAEGFLDRNPESSRHASTAVAHEHRFSVDELVQASRAAAELTDHNIIPIRKIG